MRLARLAVLLAVAAILAGCGSSHPSHARRDAVDRYIDGVDRAEAPLSLQAAKVELVFRHLALGRNAAAEVRNLARIRDLLALTERRVAAVKAPPDARRLRSKLLALLVAERDIAAELLATARYSRRLPVTLRPLLTASSQLAADLKKAHKSKQNAAAFARYRASMGGVVAALQRLRPPPLLRPSHDAEVASLQQSIVLSSSIEQAFAHKDLKAVNAGLQKLAQVGYGAAATRLHRAEVAAAAAYGRRLKRIALLADEVRRERQRLVNTLG